jgi:hypothetical protein
MFSIFLLIENISTRWPSSLKFFNNYKRNVILLENSMVLSNKFSESAFSISVRRSPSLNLWNKDFAFVYYALASIVGYLFIFLFFVDD